MSRSTSQPALNPEHKYIGRQYIQPDYGWKTSTIVHKIDVIVPPLPDHEPWRYIPDSVIAKATIRLQTDHEHEIPYGTGLQFDDIETEEEAKQVARIFKRIQTLLDNYYETYRQSANTIVWFVLVCEAMDIRLVRVNSAWSPDGELLPPGRAISRIAADMYKAATTENEAGYPVR